MGLLINSDYLGLVQPLKKGSLLIEGILSKLKLRQFSEIEFWSTVFISTSKK